MIRIAPQGAGGCEEAVEQFCAWVIKRVAQADPGDVLHTVTGSELVPAREEVLARLSRLHAPLVSV